MINENGEFAARTAMPILASTWQALGRHLAGTCPLHSLLRCDLAENRFTLFSIML
jgi:hypothetical protein